MLRRSISGWRLAAALGGAAVLAGCGGDDGTGPQGGSVRDYFAAVQAAVGGTPSVGRVGEKTPQVVLVNRAQLNLRPPTDVRATFHEGDAPSESGGPEMGVTEGSTPLTGQPYRLDVQASGPFAKIYISVDGADGYWELDLPVAQQFLALVLTLAANPPSTTFTTHTAVGGSGGVSNVVSTPVDAVSLADADLAITVKWTGASDVDLHVIDPNENEIYFGNRSTPEGGRLDLDSNAGCSIDNVNQETISWRKDTAPAGTYQVNVEYYSDCGEEVAPFTVTVQKKGASPQTFEGSFSGPSSQNEPAQVTTVTIP